MATDTIKPRNKQRQKVELKPGFHLVDWMRLTSQRDLSGRGEAPLRNISRKELAEHRSKFDCWTAYAGKVYNITPYLAYHPGGEAFLLKGAGKDCTAMFNKFHAWVNMENIMGKCLLGFLMAEEDTIEEGDEEKDDDEEKEEEKGSERKEKEEKVEAKKEREGMGDESLRGEAEGKEYRTREKEGKDEGEGKGGDEAEGNDDHK